MVERDDKPTVRVQRIDSPDGNSSLFQMSALPGEDPVRGSLKSIVEMYLAIERDVLRRKGIALTPDVEAMLQQRAEEYGRSLKREKRASGIAPHIIHLLSAPSKRDAKEIAASISDAFRDVRPGPASPKVVKAMRKMEAMFEERKRVHAHMFERGAT